MAEVTDADREAAKRHQQNFLTRGEGETSLLWEAFAAHRIAAEQATVEWIAEWLRETAPQYSHNELATRIEQGDWRND